ncbi:M6 family metalloprotease domain-containing protein [Streptomyces sp. NPDC054933]
MAVGFVALVAWSLVAGPAAAAPVRGPCALERTDVRHSEGVDRWNSGYPRPLGDVNAVMLFLSFPDHVPDVATRALTADHFPATTTFLTRASYGRFRLHPHVLQRWFRMPRPSTAYGIHRDWADGLRAQYLQDAIAAVGRAVDFRRYPVIYLVADPGARGVDADATKVINLARPIHSGGATIDRLVTVFEHHPPDQNVLAHETNHVFDLPDLYLRPPAGSNDSWDTRVGDWDLMGSQFALAPDLFAWHRWKYGWIDPGQVICVEHPGITTRTLTPVEVPGGTKLIVVRVSVTTALAIEVREARGNDEHACTQGVLLYEARTDIESGEGPITVIDGHPWTGACYGTSVYPQLADAPLGVGESYVYHFGRLAQDVLRIHVDRHDRRGWTVTADER